MMITNEPHYITTNGKSHQKFAHQFHHKQCNYTTPTQRWVNVPNTYQGVGQTRWEESENAEYCYRARVTVILATIIYELKIHTQN